MTCPCGLLAGVIMHEPPYFQLRFTGVRAGAGRQSEVRSGGIGSMAYDPCDGSGCMRVTLMMVAPRVFHRIVQRVWCGAGRGGPPGENWAVREFHADVLVSYGGGGVPRCGCL